VLDTARELGTSHSRRIESTVRDGVELPENMTDSPSQLDQESQRHNKWLILIAAYKFLLALLFIAIGAGALHLLHKDIDDVLSQFASFLRFNPESRFVNFLADKASLVDDPLLRRIGVLAFCYAGVSTAEGIGLYLEKAWGEYLTLLITASFLPWEVFEIFHRLTWVRVGVFVVNLLIFTYLLKLVSARRQVPEAVESE
jgi:uncharacterized membrane protein (DUF2068 family)